MFAEQAVLDKPPARPAPDGTASSTSPRATSFADPVSVQERLRGVDGLRAAAALWVLLFHIYAASQATFPPITGLGLFLGSGWTGVSLFLVLSGFCLYTPFAGGRAHRFKVGRFFVRRCRRLLPAYYVSLAGVLVLEQVAGRWFGSPGRDVAGIAWQAFTHLTLTHTLFPDTFYRLNGAFWSLGLEWQLYLGLPVLIWGVRRFGLPRVLATVILMNLIYRMGVWALEQMLAGPDAGPIITIILPNQVPGRWAEFAFGMLAAELHATGQVHKWAGRLKLLPALLVPLAVVGSNWPVAEILYGFAYFVVLVWVLIPNSVANKIFSWRPLVAIGTMSYSLYLIHQPIVQGLARLLQNHSGASSTGTFVVLVLTTPIILLVAWVLFVTVERRTISSGSTAASPLQVGVGPAPDLETDLGHSRRNDLSRTSVLHFDSRVTGGI